MKKNGKGLEESGLGSTEVDFNFKDEV